MTDEGGKRHLLALHHRQTVSQQNLWRHYQSEVHASILTVGAWPSVQGPMQNMTNDTMLRVRERAQGKPCSSFLRQPWHEQCWHEGGERQVVKSSIQSVN